MMNTMLPENTEQTGVVGQPITIDLQAIPGAGYMWEIELPPPELEVLDNRVVAQSEEVGGPALQRFTLLPRQSGDYLLVFGLKRKWERQSARTKIFTIHVTP
jgi:predicted secreted protein